MPLPTLSPERARELRATTDRFLAANRVSLVVGVVLTPLLFGGVALGLGLALPAPFGAWIGGAIGGAGALMLLFLLAYWLRTATRAPFAAWVTVVEWRVLRDRYGGESHSVVLRVEEARALTAAGWGAELPAYRGAQKTSVLTSRQLSGAVPVGRPVIALCMPTGEVVAFDHEGRLVTA
ncbi:MAG: hypothetical protein H6719_06030 [Sandaracinaceae bacterium]|nr:hypothetical protein [Sandaracinaceae bacterium]